MTKVFKLRQSASKKWRHRLIVRGMMAAGSRSSPESMILGYGDRIRAGTEACQRSRSAREIPGSFLWRLDKGLSLLLACLSRAKRVLARTPRARNADHLFAFEDAGPPATATCPDITLHDLDGGTRQLSQILAQTPALVVIASLTCPPARESMGNLQRLQNRFGDRLDCFVIYSIDAHPAGSPSPYLGREWVTRVNRVCGIHYAQPRNLAERTALARRLQTDRQVTLPILVDGMDNQAWRFFGASPNVALLFDKGGRVVARNGWFDAEAMTQSIVDLLSGETP